MANINAENINIDFQPNKSESAEKRIISIEEYLSTLTNRVKFCFANIYDGMTELDDSDEIKKLLYVFDSNGVGRFTNGAKINEIFNDYDYNTANGEYEHAEGLQTKIHAGLANHVEGFSVSIADGTANHAEGLGNEIDEQGNGRHIEGSGNKIIGGNYSHVEGQLNTISEGEANHAEGYGNSITRGGYDSVRGYNNKINRTYLRVTGATDVCGGSNKVTDSQYCSVRGDQNIVKNCMSTTVEGRLNEVAGADVSFVAGQGNKVDTVSDVFVFGENLKATSGSTRRGTAIFGRYNKEDYDLIFAVGNGWGDDELSRSNALEIDRNGKCYIDLEYPYEKCLKKPKINGVELIGNKSFEELGLDLSGYLEATDIADWAKAEEKPTYTAAEVGAAEANHTHTAEEVGAAEVNHTHTAAEIGAAEANHTHSTADISDFPDIPTKVSELQNDSGYLTSETDPTVPAWAKAETKPEYTAAEVGAAEKLHSHSISDITDMPTALPANGGNADTLDGKHASAFAEAEHTHTAAEVGAAPKSHTHSKSDITDFPTAMKNPSALTVQMNGKTAAEYDGGTAKTVNITPSGIGAATAADIAAAIDGLKIGGRNLLVGTSEGFSLNVDVPSSFVRSDLKNTSKEIYYTPSRMTFKDMGYSVGDEITISFDWSLSQYNDKELVYGNFRIEAYGTKNGVENAYLTYIKYPVATFSASNINGHAIITHKLTSTTLLMYRLMWRIDNTVGTFSVSNIKLEKGNKATDWSSAPEDEERRITALEARIAALEAALVSGGE